MGPSGKTIFCYFPALVCAAMLGSGCRECDNSADCNPGKICNNNFQCVAQTWEWDTTEIDTNNESDPLQNLDTGDGDGGIVDPPKKWILVDGGTFLMGSEDNLDEKPIHEVTIQPFYIMRTEVTVDAYAECVNASACETPVLYDGACSWHYLDESPKNPVNCINWQSSVDYCTYKNARLPTEAEWEYAARSGGQDVKYPWGNTEPECTLAKMPDCGARLTDKVCSRTDGLTIKHGLCDMAGNVSEWVEDTYHSNYSGAPDDGSAWPDGKNRIMRGGSFLTPEGALRVTARAYFWSHSLDVGFRCARDVDE